MKKSRLSVQPVLSGRVQATSCPRVCQDQAVVWRRHGLACVSEAVGEGAYDDRHHSVNRTSAKGKKYAATRKIKQEKKNQFSKNNCLQKCAGQLCKNSFRLRSRKLH
jgi:hypothetical protein